MAASHLTRKRSSPIPHQTKDLSPKYAKELKKLDIRTGEIAQRLRALAANSSSRGPEFNSQQPHGDSQPPKMRSGALFRPAGRILYE